MRNTQTNKLPTILRVRYSTELNELLYIIYKMYFKKSIIGTSLNLVLNIGKHTLGKPLMYIPR